jgi:hypothetical protein
MQKSEAHEKTYSSEILEKNPFISGFMELPIKPIFQKVEKI